MPREVEICNHCGKDVSFGSGLFANRVSDGNDIKTRKANRLNYPYGDFVCCDCDSKTSDEYEVFKKNSLISEKIIEDILSSDKAILAELLNINAADLSLVARQKIVQSGKLDLLYLYKDELFLIELKAVGFYSDIVNQINGYFENLRELQEQHKLINSNIRKIILVTDCKNRDVERCKKEFIQLLTYRPEFILSKYYENFKERSYFLKIQSGDYGVVRLGLLKTTLQFLSQGRGIEEISKIEGKSHKTIRNRLSIAAQLNLATKFKNKFFLTDFGSTFLGSGNGIIDDRFNDKQIELLSDFAKETPFFSSVTYTILSLVEAVFILAKNTYPVAINSIQNYFVKSVGKEQTWKADKARKTATYIYSNYACELQFLAKVDNHFYLTPKGVQSILLLQLNRSLKLIKSQT